MGKGASQHRYGALLATSILVLQICSNWGAQSVAWNQHSRPAAINTARADIASEGCTPSSLAAAEAAEQLARAWFANSLHTGDDGMANAALQTTAAHAAIPIQFKPSTAHCDGQAAARMTLASSWDYIKPEARRREIANMLYDLYRPDHPLSPDARHLAHAGFWFHVEHSSGTQSVIGCVAPKVASTNVRYLFQRYNVGKDAFLNQTYGMKRYFDAVKRSKARIYLPSLPTLATPSIPRVIFTRNPYTRLLSFFLMDKGAGFPWVCKFMYGQSCTKGMPKPTFAEFVDTVYFRWFMGPGARFRVPHDVLSKDYNYHMFPQHWFCAQPVGMQFNVVVRIEELASNYGCFVDRLGLQETVDSGWRHLNHFLNNETATADCFFRPSLDLPCDWWRVHGNSSSTAGGSTSSTAGSSSSSSSTSTSKASGTGGSTAAARSNCSDTGKGAADGDGSSSIGLTATERKALRALLADKMKSSSSSSAASPRHAARLAGHSTNARGLLHAVYDDSTRRKVAEMYALDFVKYGYSFDLP